MSKDWTSVLTSCGVRAVTAATWGPIFSEVIQDDTFSAGPDEVPYFLGNVLHESALLEKLEESLYYATPGRLMQVWPSRFATLADEVPYLRNPEALANRVYGGRMGNTNPGDGWKYRGSGLIQITGADNMRAVQAATGVPVFDQPDILRHPTAEALQVVIAWWEGHVPDAAMGNVPRIRKIVNGGSVGLAEVQRLTDLAQRALA